MAFDGFPADTVRFLADLAKHNNRPWFKANRERYEQSVRGPALAFIEAMAPRLERISRYVYADASPMGGSLMRIYRDTRFTGDKEPYKTNVGIQFRHQQGEDIHAPGLYFHIDANEVFLGCGMWKPDSTALAAIRKRIVEHPKDWKRARDSRGFVKVWGSLWGERLKRPPRGFDPDSPFVEDLKLKHFLGIADLPRKALGSGKLLDAAARMFAAGTPLMKFLCDALGLRY